MSDFPAPSSAFPAPAPAFPAPNVYPTYGLTPDARNISLAIPGAFGAPTIAGNATPATTTGGMGLLEQLTGGAIGPGNDPREWTPEDAADQTNRALARIGTANPELAQSLADQMGRLAPEEQDGGGFWHGLMGAVGDVLEVTHLDDVLELVGRSAHILPEIVMDWGKESVWTNLADALSGHSDVSWDDVLVEKFGMERNWFTAALGFIGDVATDPLTYATFGAGGIAKSVVGETVGKAFLVGEAENVLKKVAIEGAESLTKRELAVHAYMTAAMDAGAETIEQAAGTVLKHVGVGAQAAEKTSQSLFAKATSSFRAIHPDAMPGVVNTATDSLVKDGLDEMVHVADLAVKQATTGGFGKASVELAEKLGIDKSAAETVLRRWTKEGTGYLPGRAGKGLYQRGQAAAAGLGGWRFHLNIPVLGMRLSPTRVLPKVIPQADFSIARRMFAGISGERRLEKLVGKGIEGATTRDLELFWEGGYDMLKRYSPDVAKKLSGGAFSRFGSPLLATSQAIGGLTKHLAPHAAMLRGGGLGAYAAAEANQMSNHIRESLMTAARTVSRDDVTYNPTAVDELTARAFSLGRKSDQAAKDQVREALDDWGRLLPKEAGYGDSVDEMLATVPETLRPMVAENVDRLHELEDYFKAQGGGEGWLAAQLHRQQLDQVAGIRADYGVASDVNLYPLTHADEMNPTEAARVSDNAAEHLRGKRYRAVGDSEGAGAFGQAIDESQLADDAGGGMLVRGVQMEEIPDSSIGGAGAEEAQRAIDLDDAHKAVREAQRNLEGVKAKAHAGELGQADALLKSIDDAKQQLFDAQNELRLLNEKPADMFVYARNGLTVDLREGAAATESTLPGNMPRELATQYDNVLTQIRQAAGDIAAGGNPEVVAAAKQMLGQQEDVAALVTRKLQAQGYDHLRTILPDGTVRVTVFRQADGGIPTARLSQHAEWVQDQGSLLGHTGRAPSEAALKAVNRSKVRDLPGGSEKWLEENIRDVSNLPLREAEAELRKRMEAEGVGLVSPNLRVLEYDPLVAMDIHARKSTHLAARKILGQSMRQLEQLGLGSSVLNGHAAGIHRYKYTLDTALLDSVKRLGADVQAASDEATRLQVETLKNLDVEAKRAADELGQHHEMVRDAVEALTVAQRVGLSGENPVEAASKKLSEALDQPSNEWQRAFEDAVGGRRAHDLGDGVYTFEMPDGREVLVDIERQAEELGDQAPLGATEVPEGYTLYAHETSAKNVDSIKQRGIEARPDPAEESGLPRVSAFRSEDAKRRLEAGEIPSDRVIVEFKAPTKDAQAYDSGNAVKFPTTIRPEDIVGVHPPGSTRVRAARIINPDGTVLAAPAASAAKEGYATKLLRAHWQAEGVFDAEDPIAAAAAMVRRQSAGISKTEAAIGKKVVAELSEGVGRVSPEAAKTAQVQLERHLDELIRLTDETGGATFDPSTGKFARIGDTGFSVAMKQGSGAVIPAAVWADANAKKTALRQFAKDNPEVALDRVHLGTWKDGNGDVHLDISEVVKSREEALALRTQRAQEAAFDLKTGEDIVGTATSPATYGRSTEGIRKLLQQNVDDAQEALEGANIEHAAQLEEVNRLHAMLTSETAKVRPALVPVNESSLNAAGFDRLDIPGFEDLAMPSFMATEFKQAIRGFKGIEGIHAEFRKFNAWWKQQATYLWPGFHIRNMYGAFFNNLLGGVGIKDYVLAGRVQRAMREWSTTGDGGKWAKTTLIDGGDADLVKALKDNGNLVMYGKKVDELTYGDLARIGGGTGILAGNGRAFGESRVLGSQVEKESRGLLGRIPGGRQYKQASKLAGTLTENTMRVAAFAQGLRTYGTTTEARVFTMMRHGDYADLTDFEYGIVRDLIPFYKWMRTNVPFQIHQLLESPGKLLAVQKAQAAVFTGQGMDYDEARYKMPGWMGNSFVIPFSPNKDGTFESVMLDLPMSDLHISAREFASSFLPAVRPVLESYIYDQNTFTGAPIDGKRIPLAGVFNVPGIRDVLSAVGFAEKGPDGQLYTTDQKQNLLAVLPVFSRARNWMYADPDRTGLRMNAVVSAMFGVTPRSVDKDAMVASELDFYYSEVLPQLEHLRQMGYPLPTSGDIEATYGSINGVLEGLGISPGAGTTSTSPVLGGGSTAGTSLAEQLGG